MKVVKHHLPARPLFRDWCVSSTAGSGVLVWLDDRLGPILLGDCDRWGHGFGGGSDERPQIDTARVLAYARVGLDELEVLDAPAVVACSHARRKPGKSVPRRWGSWASEVCLDCGAFRTMGHHGGDVSPWRPASEYADSVTEPEEA